MATSIIKYNDLIHSNAGSHNCIYRGKNLGSSVTAAQYSATAAGTFDNLFIGDYWIIDGITWRIAAFDYWFGYGDTRCTTHHILVVPDQNLNVGDGSTTHWMNATDTTVGAYVGSDWRTGNNGNGGQRPNPNMGQGGPLKTRRNRIGLIVIASAIQIIKKK